MQTYRHIYMYISSRVNPTRSGELHVTPVPHECRVFFFCLVSIYITYRQIQTYRYRNRDRYRYRYRYRYIYVYIYIYGSLCLYIQRERSMNRQIDRWIQLQLQLYGGRASNLLYFSTRSGKLQVLTMAHAWPLFVFFVVSIQI